MVLASFDQLLIDIAECDARFRSVKSTIDDNIALLEKETVCEKLSALFSIKTELRGLKRQLNDIMNREFAHFDQGGFSKQQLQTWRGLSTRAGLIKSDIEGLQTQVKSAISICQKAIETPIFIYALSDPRTEEVRYIGKTRDPNSRLKEHLAKPVNPDMAAWIDSLASEKLIPLMEIIDITTVEDWSVEEYRHIWRYRQMGFDLLNHEGPAE